MQKFFITLGLLITTIGLVWPLISRLKFGRLPGDLFFQKCNFSFFSPLTSCLILSIIISILIFLFNKYF
ncbi:MAG: DUF2905 domain-containing protein [Rickettsia endosymbiont of Ixodes persulcatus]|nr:DUF2905 domain-containing protein [Rickettsia endosymbiont of Ixodes persulcatus]MCZ6902926.1 DUF2905 domain-containing protein [Rickettsia endosymbiont of Ixodes persulcatus]MCZ6908524.1 DUF2905 domain-containing protein [Rickettsia endosymbiont of Ixodes persulcatus]MCZ6910351.1 DUF2905 domain-containing protein [Rickettsia endosymbiont of Ixodes persulcatus]MCZ6914140.1 DUF2905 domain-containing protein [Rickettsia endosymbiont of Ixodes persulcatus]